MAQTHEKTAWIALFRGINVGGRGTLPMAELVATLESSGCRACRTYIQSGNVVFNHASKTAGPLARRIEEAVARGRIFQPRVVLLTSAELLRIIAGNPSAQGKPAPEGKTLHAWFLAENPAKPDLGRLEALRAGKERFALKGKVFYLLAPDGIGRSKLAARVEAALGVEATARNWNTVLKLRELSTAVESE